MPQPLLIPVDPGAGGDRVNVFVHGYRSMITPRHTEAARERVRRAGVTGESYLVRWMAGRWSDSATVAGLRTAYRLSRATRYFSPWALLLDAGVVGVHEATQFKLMERRAEWVGREVLPPMIAEVARGRPVNLIGHSLGARVVHHCVAGEAAESLALNDVVLLAGAADLDAPDWADCVARLGGRLYNAYSPRDAILRMTPDLKRRVGSRPMPRVVLGGQEKVVNHKAVGVSHVRHWTHLEELLPGVWPGYAE